MGDPSKGGPDPKHPELLQRFAARGIPSPASRTASSQGLPLPCRGSDPDNTPICQLGSGSGFLFVIEGRPGPLGAEVGTATFNPDGLPDLQIQVDQPLGNGTVAVCDKQPPLIGGVAPLSPPDLSFSNAGAVNDFACRFSADTCTIDQFGEPRFLSVSSTVQFCAAIDSVIAFRFGDTRVSMRLRDTGGQVSEVRQLIVQVGAGPPTPTFTTVATATVAVVTPTRTLTPSPSRTAPASASATRTPSRSLTPTESVTSTATVTLPSPSPAHTPLPTSVVTSVPTATVTPSATPIPTARSTATVTPGLIDLETLIRAIFDAAPPTGADVNDDGHIIAADIPALIALSTMAQSP